MMSSHLPPLTSLAAYICVHITRDLFTFRLLLYSVLSLAPFAICSRVHLPATCLLHSGGLLVHGACVPAFLYHWDGFRVQMSDFEYANDSNQEEWEVPFNHLMCCLCQSLALSPVRLQHVSMKEDCGTVMCLTCYKRWYRNLVDVPGVVPCPCCRSLCPHPSPEHAIPGHVTV